VDDEKALLLTALNRIDALDELVKNQQDQIDALGEATARTLSALEELVKEAKAVSGRLDNNEKFIEALLKVITVVGMEKE
jgi:ABC-type transporter Mla subunit MlaD